MKKPLFTFRKRRSVNIEYTLRYFDGLDEDLRKRLLGDQEPYDVKRRFEDELGTDLRGKYFSIEYHGFYLSKGSDEIQGFISLTMEWIGYISDIGGASAFIFMAKKALQKTFFATTQKLPDNLVVNTESSTVDSSDAKSRPKGSGIFAISIAILFLTLLFLAHFGQIKLDEQQNFSRELILKLWLAFSTIVLGGWGFNRIFMNSRVLVGQDTIKLVLAFVAITATLFSLLLKN